MSWQADTITIVRSLIGDLDGTKYVDDRLLTVIIVSANFVTKDVTLDSTYTIDISNTDISPTPEADYITLIALKAASIVLNGEAKLLAEKAIKVVDGPSRLEFGAAYTAMRGVANKADEDYHYARVAYQAGNSKAGRIILTPFTAQPLAEAYVWS
jgi:hypothetical protein